MKERHDGDEFIVGQPAFRVWEVKVSNVMFEGQLVSGSCPHLQAKFSALAPQSVKIERKSPYFNAESRYHGLVSCFQTPL